MAEGRVLDLHLHLLDRQVVAADGQLAGKVDDLELQLDETGRPYVTAILVGPRALGGRLGGRLGRWITAIACRLSDNDQIPTIDFALVTDIGSAVKVARTREELAVEPLERWVDQHIISRIPGSRHAS